MFHTGLRPTRNQAARAEAYKNYVRSVLALPQFVGCHWFQYVDQALTGRFDGENYNIGLVTVTDTPYPELTQAAREINAKVYR
jgi:agarase